MFARTPIHLTGSLSPCLFQSASDPRIPSLGLACEGKPRPRFHTNRPEASLPPARTSIRGQPQGRLGLLSSLPAGFRPEDSHHAPHHAPTRERACSPVSAGGLSGTTPLPGRRSHLSWGSACCSGTSIDRWSLQRVPSRWVPLNPVGVTLFGQRVFVHVLK